MSEDSSVSIQRLVEVNSSEIEQLNKLFDEGTEWDLQQGNLFLTDPNNALFVGYYQSQMAGFVTGYRLQRFDNRKAEVLLYEIGVNESFRRKGIARALIERLKNWAKEVHADEVWVLTERSNIAAVRLYTACGGKEENHGDEVMFVMKV